MAEKVENVDENVKVLVRVRPLNSREACFNKKCLTVDSDNCTVIINAKPQPKVFAFDRVCGEDSTQEQIFHAVGRKLTDSCLKGYNGTIFAYGQTGSGKTHTVLGQQDKRGLVPRVLDYLFSSIDRQQRKSLGRTEYLCRCSVLEIYNESVYDLLDAASTGLQLREDMTKGVYVDGLTEQVVSDAMEAEAVVNLGIRNRRVGETAMNRESSRSHCVFTLTIEASFMENDIKRTRNARFNMVDLAGSERQKSTAAAGDRLKEASSINKSLSALGNVIMSLVEKAKGKSRHVHYRDSRLTFLLKDSLGGNSKSHIIATVSPSENSFGETLSTLKFAQRAKMIKNNAVVNEDSSGTMIQLKKELNEARAQLMEYKGAVSENGADKGTIPSAYKDVGQALQRSLEQLQDNKAGADAFVAGLTKKNNTMQRNITRLQHTLAGQKLVGKLREEQLRLISKSGKGTTIEDERCVWTKERQILNEQLQSPPEAVDLLLKCDDLEAELEIYRCGGGNEAHVNSGGYESIRRAMYDWTHTLLSELKEFNVLNKRQSDQSAKLEHIDGSICANDEDQSKASLLTATISAGVAAELYSNIEDLKEQLKTSEVMAAEIQKTQEHAQTQLKTEKTRLIDAQDQCENAKKQVQELQMTVATLTTRVDTERQMYEDRVTSLTAQCASTRSAGNESAKVEHALREQLASSFKDQAVLSQRCDSLQLQLQQQAEEFEQVKQCHAKEVNQLKLQSKRVEEETVSAFEEYVKDTEESTKAHKDELAKVKKLHRQGDEKLRGEIEEHSVRFKEESIRRMNLETEIKQCEVQLHQVESDLSRVQKEHTSLKQQAEKMEFEMGSLQEDNDTLSEQSHFAEAALKEERECIMRLTEELEHERNQVTRLELELQSMEGEVGSDKQLLSVTVQAKVIAEKKVESMKNDIETLKIHREECTQQIQDAERREKAQSEALLEMQATLQQERRETEEVRAEMEDAKAAQSTLQSEAKNTKNDLIIQQQKVAQLEQERQLACVKQQKSDFDLQKTQSQILTLETEQKAAETKSAFELRSAADEHQIEIKRLTSEHNQRLQALQEEIDEAQQIHQQQLVIVQAQLSKSGQQINALATAKTLAQEKVAEERETAAQQQRELKHKIHEVQRENTTLSSRLVSIRKALETTDALVDGLPRSDGQDQTEGAEEPVLASAKVVEALHARRQEILALKAEINSLRLEVTTVTEACRLAELQSKTMAQDAADATAATEKSEKQCLHVEGLLTQARVRVGQLTEKVKCLEQAAEAKRMETMQSLGKFDTLCSDKDEQISALQAENAAVSEKLVVLEKASVELTESHNKGNAKICKLQSDLESANKCCDAHHNERSARESEHAAVLEELKTIRAEKDSFGIERAKWREEIENIQALEEETFRKKQAAEQAHESTKADAQKLAKELQVVIQNRDKLKEQNAKLIGHQNPRQKIQLHVKIKEENNQLRKSAQLMADQIASLKQKMRAHDDISYMTSDKENQLSRTKKVREENEGGAEVTRNRAILQ